MKFFCKKIIMEYVFIRYVIEDSFWNGGTFYSGPNLFNLWGKNDSKQIK